MLATKKARGLVSLDPTLEEKTERSTTLPYNSRLGELQRFQGLLPTAVVLLYHVDGIEKQKIFGKSLLAGPFCWSAVQFVKVENEEQKAC